MKLLMMFPSSKTRCIASLCHEVILLHEEIRCISDGSFVKLFMMFFPSKTRCHVCISDGFVVKLVTMISPSTSRDA